MRLAALVALALLPLLAVACGGGDDSSGITVSTLSPTKRPTATPASSTPVRSAPAEKPTPTVEPSEAPTPTPGPPTERPTPAAVGTPAAAPADTAAFLAQFQGKPIVLEPCIYNPTSVITDCSPRGLYAIDPPITGQDITCSLLIVDDSPRAIQCQSQEPLQTKVYEIK